MATVSRAAGVPGSAAVMVEGLVECIRAVASSGASKAVAAAMAAALFRAALVPGLPAGAISEEVEVRAAAILPVIEAKVRAGAAGVAPAVTGRRRAARNVAEHSLFGAGAAAVQQALQAPQHSQRAGRSVRAARGESPADGSEVEASPGRAGPVEVLAQSEESSSACSGPTVADGGQDSELILALSRLRQCERLVEDFGARLQRVENSLHSEGSLLPDALDTWFAECSERSPVGQMHGDQADLAAGAAVEVCLDGEAVCEGIGECITKELLPSREQADKANLAAVAAVEGLQDQFVGADVVTAAAVAMPDRELHFSGELPDLSEAVSETNIMQLGGCKGAVVQMHGRIEGVAFGAPSEAVSETDIMQLGGCKGAAVRMHGKVEGVTFDSASEAASETNFMQRGGCKGAAVRIPADAGEEFVAVPPRCRGGRRQRRRKAAAGVAADDIEKMLSPAEAAEVEAAVGIFGYGEGRFAEHGAEASADAGGMCREVYSELNLRQRVALLAALARDLNPRFMAQYVLRLGILAPGDVARI